MQKSPTNHAVLAVSEHITSSRLLVSSDKEYEKYMHTSKDMTRERRVLLDLYKCLMQFSAPDERHYFGPRPIDWSCHRC